LPEFSISGAGDAITVRARLQWTFPLALAEIVWSDGLTTHREMPALESTREFGQDEFTWTIPAKDWKWARLAVWDVAGDGALTNPVWR